MSFRRLDPVKDEHLLREAYLWDKGAPTWYRDMDSVFGPENVEDFLKTTHDPDSVFIGVFRQIGLRMIRHELVGVIILAYAGERRYAAHLCAKRGANLETLAQAAIQVKEDMFDLGMIEVFVFVAERNKGVLNLCRLIGLVEDGVVMFKGTYRKKLIRWIRLSSRRLQKVAKAA